MLGQREGITMDELSELETELDALEADAVARSERRVSRPASDRWARRSNGLYVPERRPGLITPQ